jgi:putative intracellular protease/amidase
MPMFSGFKGQNKKENLKKMKKIKIAILLYDGITAMDAVESYEILSRIPDSKVFFVSSIPGQINCSSGLRLTSDYSVKDISEFDIMLIPGGKEMDSLLKNLEIIDLIRNVNGSKEYTSSILNDCKFSVCNN